MKTIGSGAFEGCAKLSSVTFGKTLTSIGDCAFYNCKNLTGISLPSSLKKIGRFAFYNSGLKKVYIPKNVISIGMRAFLCCKSLTKIVVSSGNTRYSAKNGVLYNKAQTKLIQYPQGKSDTSFKIPAGVKTIGEYAFYACKKLKTVEIGSKVSKIGDGAFCKCKKLTSVIIPNSVKSIGNSAFENCAKLKTVTIGTGLTELGDAAFHKCSALETVTFKGSAPTFNSDYGLCTFGGVAATIKYPSAQASSWTKSLRDSLAEYTEMYGGSLKFVAY